MTIQTTDLSSHELRELYWQEEAFVSDLEDEEESNGDEYEDDVCYLELGDMEVGQDVGMEQ